MSRDECEVTLALSPAVSTFECDDGVVLFVETTQEMVRLNPTAALIWRGLNAGLSHSEIIDAITRASHVPSGDVQRDLATFIDHLRQKRLLLPHDGIVPMLHAHTLLKAYKMSDCMAALHAASVLRNGRCVLMPAISGSGKSTLAAALVARGFQYCSDEVVLLTHAPIRVKPIPTSIGLKSGSWTVLADMYPDLRKLPVHTRADGREIRYLSPPNTASGMDADYKASCVVFPVWRSGAAMEIERIGTSDAISRIATCGFDVRRHLDTSCVQALIEWLAIIPCYAMTYDSLADGVRGIEEITA